MAPATSAWSLKTDVGFEVFEWESRRSLSQANPTLSMLAFLRAHAIIAIIDYPRRHVMAQLVVRNLDDDVVQALKQRAAAQGKSAEETHRQILQSALRGPKRRSFAEVISAMPNVGEDADFERSTTQA